MLARPRARLDRPGEPTGAAARLPRGRVTVSAAPARLPAEEVLPVHAPPPQAERTRLAQLERMLAQRDQALADSRAKVDQCEAQLWSFHVKIERLLQDAASHAEALAAARAGHARLAQEHLRVVGSLSWRLTRPLRTAFSRYPRQMRAGVTLGRLGWWMATLQFGRMAARWRDRAALRRQEALVGTDPMFDAAFYAGQDPAVLSSGLSPLRHYLAVGAREGRNPHPLFDSAWYRETYGDLGGSPALAHYITQGRAAGLWPNPFFDPGWYRGQHPELAASGEEPVQHFMRIGAAERADPSPTFRTRGYLARNPDVASAGLNPLEHYLLFGRREGRDISTWEVDFSTAVPVDRTRIECRKRPAGGEAVALFVTHSGDGRLKPHVRTYLEALRREGVAITLIVAADHGFGDDAPWLYDLLDGLYVRDNEGWDFACWAHVLRLNRGFYAASVLYWLNDSVIGPVNQAAFHRVIERVRGEDAGMVGLTANAERGRHIQSYFLAFKPKALRAFAFHQFVLGVRSFADKEDVINAYEIKLAPTLEAAGIRTAALFEPEQIHNPTIYEWKPLLNQGFPFLKVLAITHDIRHVDKTGWREELHRHGYDVLLVDRLLAARETAVALPPGAVVQPQAPALANQPPQVTFLGPQSYANGLGVAARGYLAALMHTGLPVNMLPIERPFHIHQRVTPSLPSTECLGPADVMLIHVNPGSWQHLLPPPQLRLVDEARHRIGLFVWESQILPPEFLATAARLDAVWAPSRFCADAFRAASGTPVRVVPYVVPVRPLQPRPAQAARLKQELGMAPDERVILYSFDASSYLARKNPAALLRAFDRSGLVRTGWRLLLKTKHLAEAGRDGEALAEAAALCRGAQLLDRPLGLGAARALLEMADVYASPHASEGFGLTVAEAMALGKPVVASDFGGSTDILDAHSGFPVRCAPWVLPADTGAYAAGTTWGLVDEDALAGALEHVAGLSAPELAALGARARGRVQALFSPEAVAAEMRAGIAAVLSQ